MNAIGYVRISKKDQSAYSLADQEARIREYCERNELYLDAVYRDDGECSETFDRPDYIALENFIKLHKGEVNFLIVLDHDRFSRNVAEALQKIEYLQKKFSVKVLSVAEPLNLDITDPNVFLSRAFKYVFANHELLNIRKRTARGMRNAMESGRCVSKAPYGYFNQRDERGRPILVIDEEKAKVVREIFEQFLAGLDLGLLRKNATKLGCVRTGHSAMTKLLNNPLYAGLIKLPAYEGKPERMIKALHEPIISEATFWIAQELLRGRPGQKAKPKDEFPLRGLLRCECGAHMTAGFTKGRSKYYLYYQCTKERGRSYKGEHLHERVENLLYHLSFTNEQVDRIATYSRQEITHAMAHNTERVKTKMSDLKAVNEKIERLEEKIVNDLIEPKTYKVWYARLNGEKSVLENDISALKKRTKPVFDDLEQVIPHLTNLKGLYNEISLEGKQLLLKTGFELGIAYDGKLFRTAMINPALVSNYVRIKEKGLLVVEQPEEFFAKSLQCTA
jgi:site-specific DNA recombinase